MRKRKYTIGAMAALSFTLGMTSCQSELAELTPSGGERIILTATQDDEAGICIYLNNDKQVVWGEGDALSVFDTKNINQVFELTKGAGSTTADFGGTVSADSREEYYAVYPYGADYTISSGTVTGITLPAEQTAVANGFDKSVAIMTGYTTKKENLAFKQLCAFVLITTKSATKKIVFRTNGTESLAGTLSVAINEEGIGSATVTSGGTGTVTLVPAGNEESIAAGTYLIAVLPGTLTQGFTMECVGTDGSELTRSYNGSTSVLSRAAVINMGTASEEQGWTATIDGHGYVDLGIRMNGKKILFATCNVGADSPEEYGDYFAWGATEPYYTSYTMNGTTLTVTSWKDGRSAGYAQANAPFYSSGTYYDAIYTKYTAGGDVLAAEDDAARANMGGEWRMPTTEEMQALDRNTTNVWTANYNNTGIAGHIFTGKGDYASSSLFLPAAGLFNGTSYNFGGSNGYYWSSTLNSSTSTRGCDLFFVSYVVIPQDYNIRYDGFPVRAVRAVSE